MMAILSVRPNRQFFSLFLSLTPASRTRVEDPRQGRPLLVGPAQLLRLQKIRILYPSAERVGLQASASVGAR